MSEVIIVGAGLAGLSAACHLRGRGHDVLLLERDDRPGGRAGRVTREGFTFDTGPTVMTMPGLLDDVLQAAGGSVEADIPMRPLDPAYRATFADGSEILVPAGHEAMVAEIERTCGRHDADAYETYVAWLRRLYELEMPHFVDRNFNSPLDFLARPLPAAKLLGMGALRRLGPQVRSRFDDERLHRLLTFQAMYAGLPPESALSIYAVITYMDVVEGVYCPTGGMGAIPEGMARVAQRAGVDIRYGSRVTSLERADEGGRVTGVRTADGERHTADAVVVTLDLPTAYEELMPELAPPRAARSGTYSPSAVVWHVGATGQPVAGTAHHNIHFGQAWGSSFESLMRRHELMPDPSRLVTVPTLSEPSLAPDGDSVLYVLEPVPHDGSGLDWDRERGPMRERLQAFLGEHGYPTEVRAEHLVTPADWARDGMARGTPFALSHTLLQTGPFRPSNVDARVPGLVLAGSGTIPGVGVPMVLVSGKLAADRVDALTRQAAA